MHKLSQDNLRHTLINFRRRMFRGASRHLLGSSIKGALDVLDYEPERGWVVSGWAFDEANPLRRLDVNVLQGDRIVAHGRADNNRQDLRAAGIGDGAHGFSLPLDASPGMLDLKLCCENWETTRVLAAQSLIGQVDVVKGIVVHGWACNLFAPSEPLVLDMILDGAIIDRVKANQRRTDLREAGLGDVGFSWVLPHDYIDGRERKIEVRVSNGTQKLKSNVESIRADTKNLTATTRSLLYFYNAQLSEIKSPMSAGANLPSVTDGRIISEIAPLDVILDRRGDICAEKTQKQSDVNESIVETYKIKEKDRLVLWGTQSPDSNKFLVTGRLSLISDLCVSGWIEGAEFRSPPVIDVMIDNVVVETLITTRTVRANVDASYKFTAIIPLAYADGLPHTISIRLSNTSLTIAKIEKLLIKHNNINTKVLRVLEQNERSTRQIESIYQAILQEGQHFRQYGNHTDIDIILDRVSVVNCI